MVRPPFQGTGHQGGKIAAVGFSPYTAKKEMDIKGFRGGSGFYRPSLP